MFLFCSFSVGIKVGMRRSRTYRPASYTAYTDRISHSREKRIRKNKIRIEMVRSVFLTQFAIAKFIGNSFFFSYTSCCRCGSLYRAPSTTPQQMSGSWSLLLPSPLLVVCRTLPSLEPALFQHRTPSTVVSQGAACVVPHTILSSIRTTPPPSGGPRTLLQLHCVVEPK